MSSTKAITGKRRTAKPSPRLSTKGSSQPTKVVAEYQRPQDGIFLFLPDGWVPYAELMRFDRPAGFWAFFWHYLIGLGYALNLRLRSFPLPTSLQTIASLVLYLFLWTTIFRGITCTWNDIMDQDIDRQVERTRFRAIARGAVSNSQALFFTLVQIVVGGVLLAPLPRAAVGYALFEGLLLFIYPLLKRLTNFPQFELGFGMAYSILMVCAMLDHDPLAPLWASGQTNLVGALEDLARSPLFRSTMCLCTATILWTVIFDTIYAHQDYEDDSRAGVKGLAVRLGRDGTKPALAILGVIQVTCLVAVGIYSGFGMEYFILSSGGAAASLVALLWCVQLKKKESCAFWFGPGSHFVGLAVVSGLMGEFAKRKMGW